MHEVIENKLARFAGVGLFIVTVLVVAGPVSEPANAPKLLALGALALGLSPIFFYVRFDLIWKQHKAIFLLCASFLLFSITSVFLSVSPLSQNIYGVYGRNTGLLTFTFFTLILLTVSLFRQKKSIEIILYALISAGIVNVAYGFVDHFIGDPIPWNNNYGAFLGTLGNPNFAGAFLGIMTGVFFAFALNSLSDVKNLSIYVTLLILNCVVVLFTKTTQGILVSAASASVVFIYFIHKRLKKLYVTATSLFFIGAAAALAVAGILQKGPLSSFLYKRSVSLRGVYWDAAFQTGAQNPVFGVGLDGFADWYRRARSLKAATWLPGPETITNAAHNYYLDIFASGGILLLGSYIAISILGFYCAIKVIKISEGFDSVGIALVSAFIGFQAQAIISIPQIGVAVWGWVFIGALYAYMRQLEAKDSVINTGKKINPKQAVNSPVGVFIFIGASIGILLAVPPYSADAKWTNALNSSDLAKFEAALKPSYFNPANINRYVTAIFLMEKNNLPNQAHTYAQEAVKFNPENFDAWKSLYFVTKASNEERNTALENMKRLDPKNKNLSSL